MKISEFIISTTGLLYSMKTSNLAALIIFGILAIMAFRRIMFDVSQMEMEDEEDVEGGVEPWESLGREIRHWRRRR